MFHKIEKNNAIWDIVIKPSTSLIDVRLSEIWAYKDLIYLLVRRDFVAVYKQTILGPIWFFIQPLLTTIIFTIIFGKVANLSTDGAPQILFYLSGVTVWNYFADCLNGTSNTFIKNAELFGKVYFPRIIIPISVIISNLIKFGIQLLLLCLFWLYYCLQGYNLQINIEIFLFPVLVLLMAGMGLGLGLIISSLTTKYRDLVFLITFGIQLLMYASPVIYPLSIIPEKYRIFLLANPMTSIIEIFRYIFLNAGVFEWSHLLYSSSFTVIVIITGVVVFNQVQKSFMDSV